MMISDETSYSGIQEHVKLISSFLSSYSWLADSFVLEFFTDNHWEKLSKSWCTALEDVDLLELADWLSSDPMTWKRGSNVWPLSLQALRATVRALSLPRKPPEHAGVIVDYITSFGCHPLTESLDRSPINDPICNLARYESLCTKSAVRLPNDTRWKTFSEELSKAAGQHEKLAHSFRRCVKPKKQHEIARMAQVVNTVAERCGNCKLAVDVGSGQGHLSRLLTFGFDFSVVSIEAEGTHVVGAQNLDAKVVSDILKKKCKAEDSCMCSTIKRCDSVPASPKHVMYRIDSDVTATEFTKVLSHAFHMNRIDSFVLIGLHTCGNLSPNILKMYVKCPSAVALVSVPCCYMKLDDLWECSSDLVEMERLGYPMSRFVRSLKHCRLSYEAKEVACHAIEHYLQRLRCNSKSLRIHCYRATLETLITKHQPLMKRLGLRSVKIHDAMPFSEYAQLALQRAGLEIPQEDMVSHEVHIHMSQWKRVIVFYSLRLLIAPVIETLILLDRMLFLWEKGLSAFIIPIFDPNLSPRNHVLISMKIRIK